MNQGVSENGVRARQALFATMIAACLVVAQSSAAQDRRAPDRLFESGDTVQVTLTGPWRELVRDDNYQGTYPATLEYTDESGNTTPLDVTVERRGKTRQRVCKIPPIKLRFDKQGVKGTMFRGQKSLKLVTHCESIERYQQYYVLEFLAYRIYNLLTDFSFRVRPLTATYLQVGADEEEDSGFSLFKKKTSEGPAFAFLIEEDKDVANRHDLKNLHIPRIDPGQLDTDVAALYSLFQYLIANPDWAATAGPDPEECCHNSKLIGPEPTEPGDVLYPVPYDFDSSGLVDSEYAVPPEGLSIRSVTQRVYRGYCAHNAALEGARQEILASEQAIYQLFEAEARLTPDRRDKALRFLGNGFEVLRDDEMFASRIVEKCR